MENTNVLFDRKRLVRLIVPLIVEQVLAVTVGMADMVMVSGCLLYTSDAADEL